MPCRTPEAEITDEHRDVAAALQECLDETMLASLRARRTNHRSDVDWPWPAALHSTAPPTASCFNRAPSTRSTFSPPRATTVRRWGLRSGGPRNTARSAMCACPSRFWVPPPRDEDIDRALEDFRSRIETVHFSTLRETCARQPS